MSCPTSVHSIRIMQSMCWCTPMWQDLVEAAATNPGYALSGKYDENLNGAEELWVGRHLSSGQASRRTCLQADTPPGRTCLQEDIPPVAKFFRCLQSDNPLAEGLQEDSSPAQRLQADRPPGRHSSSQKNIQVKTATYTVEIQFVHHNLNSSSHPVPILSYHVTSSCLPCVAQPNVVNHP